MSLPILTYLLMYVCMYVHLSCPVLSCPVGIAQDGIGISEKVWMTYDRIGIQPGSYDGMEWNGIQRKSS